MDKLQDKEKDFGIETEISAIKKFHDKATQNDYERYMSWEYCYNAFRNRRNDKSKENIDYLALHLGFYLASWGMMRGSSFLLQKSYKVHTKVVEEILKEDYNELNGITAEEMLTNNDKNANKSNNIKKIIKLANVIKNIYSRKGKETNNVTDTLVTKILLGTLGCTPAYDRYFKESLKEYGYCQTFNEKSLTEVANFYISNKNKFDNLLKELNKNTKGIEYTQMKLMDMCMWQMAMDKQKKDN